MPSLTFNTVDAILNSAEEAKKRKDSQAAEARHASFSPFVISVDGVLAREAKFFVKRIAGRLYP